MRCPPCLCAAPLVALLLAVGALTIAGCSHHIGDSCNVNTDCSPLGDRFCDIASPGGYCTQEGCDYNTVTAQYTCADNAVCVRFFTLKRNGLSCSFDPQHPTATGCQSGDLCLCDQGMDSPSECQGKVAYCAAESTERRWCMLPCGNDGDCRTGTCQLSGANCHHNSDCAPKEPCLGGYSCLSTGGNGAIPIPFYDSNGVRQDWTSMSLQFCAPTPQS